MCSTENEKLLNFESSVLKVTERNCWSVVISLLRLECVKKGYSILQTLHLTCRRILDINDYCIQCVAVNAAVYRNTYNVVSFKFNEILVFSLLSIAIFDWFTCSLKLLHKLCSSWNPDIGFPSVFHRRAFMTWYGIRFHKVLKRAKCVQCSYSMIVLFSVVYCNKIQTCRILWQSTLAF